MRTGILRHSFYVELFYDYFLNMHVIRFYYIK